jgi:hypothetical protein
VESIQIFRKVQSSDKNFVINLIKILPVFLLKTVYLLPGLELCTSYCSFEPPCLQEGRLATIARLDLLELETFLDSLETKV